MSVSTVPIHTATINDTRCCGACHCLCPSKQIHDKNDKRHICTKNVIDFWNSGAIQTHCGIGHTYEDNYRECGCDDCFATTLCLPFKIPFVWPCFIGSLFNACVNKVRSTDSNYLC